MIRQPQRWKHLRTTNVVESPFAALRLRTDAAKRYKKVAKVTWKMLLIAEQRFWKLDAPDKMKLVYLGIDLLEGVEANREEARAVARPIYTPIDGTSL